MHFIKKSMGILMQHRDQMQYTTGPYYFLTNYTFVAIAILTIIFKISTEPNQTVTLVFQGNNWNKESPYNYRPSYKTLFWLPRAITQSFKSNQWNLA